MSSLEQLASSGLVRQRLLDQLDAARTAPLAVVVAPAGFGKTTLLAHFARAFAGPVGWLAAVPADADPAVFAGRLRAALRQAGDPTTPATPATNRAAPAGAPQTAPVDSIDLAAAARHAGRSGDTLLVIDDAHWLEDTRAEAALERALAQAPTWLHTVLATRRMPSLNLCRYELDGLVIIDAEQLRFRSWEIEQLLRDVYQEPLPPADTAALARRIGGWVAGLHMFHLSTRGRPLAERRAAVAALAGRVTLTRAYLARTVVAELPADLQAFLTRTAVFDVLTPARCDRLLGRTDSRRRLAELVRLQAFTTTADGGQTYRYHEAMRSHLAATLASELGEAPARQWYARAGELLVAEGALAEAARAYAHAEDWPAVRRLLDQLGPYLLEVGVEPWRDLLPAWLVADDPWMLVAEGQHRFSRGQPTAAIEQFSRAEELFGSDAGRSHCRQAKSRARTWLPGPARAHGPWWNWLRTATQRHPGLVAERALALPDPPGRVVRVVAHLLDGQVREAGRLLREADLSHPGVAGLALRCLFAAGEHAQQRPGSAALLGDAAAEAERCQVPWLARMARAAAALDRTERGAKTALGVADECRRDGDQWGAAIATGLAWLSYRGHDRAAAGALAELVQATRELDAPVLEAWARRLLADAAAAAGRSDAASLAVRATAAARAAGARAIPGELTTALAAADPTERPAAAPAYPARSPLEIRCLGGFRVYRNGEPVQWSGVRPRARALIRLLALHADRPVHREVLVETFWPGLSPAAATHNLHVALSSLRKLLEPAAGRQPRLLVRDGDAYRLVIPASGYCDVASLREALAEVRRARLATDPAAMLPALRTAVASYTGELLPEDGAAEWVVEEREWLRQGVADAAATLASLELDRGDPAAAVAAAERGLEIDRYQDTAWRVLIRAYRNQRNWGAAKRAASRYGEALAELGLPPEPGFDTATTSR